MEKSLNMIRFLDLTDQITEGEKNFAFFDTVTGSMCSFNGEQVFDSWKDFEEAYFNTSFSTGDYGSAGVSDLHSLDRLQKLVPEGFFSASSKLENEVISFVSDLKKVRDKYSFYKKKTETFIF
jgi:hypothetical protein